MRGLIYEDLAMRYEVDVCPGGCGLPGHQRGFVHAGLLHWTMDRQVTRAGLRHFLMLVAPFHVPPNGRYRFFIGDRDVTPLVSMQFLEPAARIYVSHLFAYRTALNDLGVRLPASLAETDKARVRALLANAPAAVRRSRVGRWAGLR